MIYRQPADQKNGPNCGPTSVAVLTANPLANVMAFIKADCHKGPNWKGSTHNRGGRFGGENADCFKALAHFGANPKVESRWEEQYAGRQLRSVIADLPRDRAYFICTGGHAQAVVGDRVFDQSTSVEGDHISAYWGRNKKVNVIISVDRLTDNSTEENIVSNPIAVPPLADFTAIVASYEADAASSASTIKNLTAEKNGAKIAAYAHLIAGLITHKVRKGTAQAGEIKAALIEQGVSKACAKRYLENGQKAKALAWIKSAGTDAPFAQHHDAILAAFKENDIKTEQDLVNIVCPKPVLTAAEELAAKAQALTDSDDAAIQALLDAAALIKAAQVPLNIAA